MKYLFLMLLVCSSVAMFGQEHIVKYQCQINNSQKRGIEFYKGDFQMTVSIKDKEILY